MTIEVKCYRINHISYLLLLMTLPLWVSCSKSTKNNSKKARNTAASDITNRPGVILSKDAQKQEAILAVALPEKNIKKNIKALGVVLSPRELTTIYSRYQQENTLLKKLKAQLFVSQKEYRRISKLYENQQASQKTFEIERAQWIADKSNYDEAMFSLKAMSDSVRQEWGPVITKWVKKGSPKLKRIIELKSCIVLITPSGNLSEKFEPPRKITLGSSQKQLYPARFISVSPKLDPRMQTRGYFYLTENKSNDLAPYLNVVAWLPTGKTSTGVMIPDSAVVWSQGLPWIYVQKGPANFVRKSISSAQSTDSGWLVMKNISTSERVVVSGAQFLLSQEMLSKMPVQQGDGDGN